MLSRDVTISMDEGPTLNHFGAMSHRYKNRLGTRLKVPSSVNSSNFLIYFLRALTEVV